MDIRQVDIGGYGDPLMDPGLKEKIYFIKSEFPEMKIATITTGQLLCEDIADFIAENVDDLKISNYGMTKKKNIKSFPGLPQVLISALS